MYVILMEGERSPGFAECLQYAVWTIMCLLAVHLGIPSQNVHLDS